MSMKLPRHWRQLIWVWLLAMGLAVSMTMTGRQLFAANKANDVYEGGQSAQPKPAAASSEKSDADLKRIEEKLDEILKVQETILAQYDDIMENLRIAKVRASR